VVLDDAGSVMIVIQ